MGSTSRPMVLWGLIAAHAAAAGRRVSVADVCAVAVCSAQASGAWLAAASSRGPDFVMCVTDRVSEQLAELQLTLGEGPCHDVLTAAAPVLAGDLGDQESGRRWPAFTPEARNAGAAAVFAFPLMIGAIRAGVIGLYRDSPGPLSSPQLGDCLHLADTATVLLLDGLDGDNARRTAPTVRPTAHGRQGGVAPRPGLARPPIWRSTGLRSTRPPGCSPCSSASPPRKRSPGSGPTLMPRTGGSPTWPVTSSPAACAWTAIQPGTPGHDPTGPRPAGSQAATAVPQRRAQFPQRRKGEP